MPAVGSYFYDGTTEWEECEPVYDRDGSLGHHRSYLPKYDGATVSISVTKGGDGLLRLCGDPDAEFPYACNVCEEGGFEPDALVCEPGRGCDALTAFGYASRTVVDGMTCRELQRLLTIGYNRPTAEVREDMCDRAQYNFHQACCGGRVPPAISAPRSETSYLYFADQLTWSEARASCQVMGGDLASIHSWADAKHAFPQEIQGYAWIGLTDAASEGQWVWSDGSPLGFTNWADRDFEWATETYPADDRSARDLDCGATAWPFFTNFIWFDQDCEDTAGYVCGFSWSYDDYYWWYNDYSYEDPDEPTTEYSHVCSVSCMHFYDGDCDDGGPSAEYNLCDYGSDCADCGVRAFLPPPPIPPSLPPIFPTPPPSPPLVPGTLRPPSRASPPSAPAPSPAPASPWSSPFCWTDLGAASYSWDYSDQYYAYDLYAYQYDSDDQYGDWSNPRSAFHNLTAGSPFTADQEEALWYYSNVATLFFQYGYLTKCGRDRRLSESDMSGLDSLAQSTSLSPSHSQSASQSRAYSSSRSLGHEQGTEDENEPDCAATCTWEPTNCAEFLVIVNGCASSCPDDLKTFYATRVPGGPCTWSQSPSPSPSPLPSFSPSPSLSPSPSPSPAPSPAHLPSPSTSPPSSSVECSDLWCTSPDGNGGLDCWAGSRDEACTCSQGSARMTGLTITAFGTQYFEYRCCSSEESGANTGEECGNYIALDGEQACEGHGYEPDVCASIGCCQYDDGQCWSAVGTDPCQSVRLVGGTTSNSGRLEIYYDGAWGTVCDDAFDSVDAEVVCRQLGLATSDFAFFTVGTDWSGSNTIAAGSGPIWLDQVACFGGESSLADCSHYGWGYHDCSHYEDVAVRCGGTPPSPPSPPSVPTPSPPPLPPPSPPMWPPPRCDATKCIDLNPDDGLGPTCLSCSNLAAYPLACEGGLGAVITGQHPTLPDCAFFTCCTILPPEPPAPPFLPPRPPAPPDPPAAPSPPHPPPSPPTSTAWSMAQLQSGVCYFVTNVTLRRTDVRQDWNDDQSRWVPRLINEWVDSCVPASNVLRITCMLLLSLSVVRIVLGVLFLFRWKVQEDEGKKGLNLWLCIAPSILTIIPVITYERSCIEPVDSILSKLADNGAYFWANQLGYSVDEIGAFWGPSLVTLSCVPVIWTVCLVIELVIPAGEWASRLENPMPVMPPGKTSTKGGEMEQGALKVQSTFRGRAGRKKVAAARKERETAATRMQAIYRGRSERRGAAARSKSFDGAAAIAPAGPMGTLRVHVQRATNLKAADRNGLSDPYVVLSVAAQTHRSATIRSTLNPEWDEAVVFEGSLSAMVAEGLTLRVWDWDLGSRDDKLGEARVDLSPLQAVGNSQQSCVVPLVEQLREEGAVAPATPAQGNVHLHLSWAATGVEHEPLPELAAADQPGPKQPEGPLEEIGVLRIFLQKARGLPAADSNGLSDPYVKLSTSFGAKKELRSKTIKKTLDPVWDETFEIADVVRRELLEGTLRLAVYDSDQGSWDDKLCIGDVELTPLATSRSKRFEVRLVNPNRRIDRVQVKGAGAGATGAAAGAMGNPKRLLQCASTQSAAAVDSAVVGVAAASAGAAVAGAAGATVAGAMAALGDSEDGMMYLQVSWVGAGSEAVRWLGALGRSLTEQSSRALEAMAQFLVDPFDEEGKEARLAADDILGDAGSSQHDATAESWARRRYYVICWEGPRHGQSSTETFSLGQLARMREAGALPEVVQVWPVNGDGWRQLRTELHKMRAELGMDPGESNNLLSRGAAVAQRAVATAGQSLHAPMQRVASSARSGGAGWSRAEAVNDGAVEIEMKVDQLR